MKIRYNNMKLKFFHMLVASGITISYVYKMVETWIEKTSPYFYLADVNADAGSTIPNGSPLY
jgi:hypothetical protein